MADCLIKVGILLIIIDSLIIYAKYSLEFKSLIIIGHVIIDGSSWFVINFPLIEYTKISLDALFFCDSYDTR